MGGGCRRRCCCCCIAGLFRRNATRCAWSAKDRCWILVAGRLAALHDDGRLRSDGGQPAPAKPRCEACLAAWVAAPSCSVVEAKAQPAIRQRVVSVRCWRTQSLSAFRRFARFPAHFNSAPSQRNQLRVTSRKTSEPKRARDAQRRPNRARCLGPRRALIGVCGSRRSFDRRSCLTTAASSIEAGPASTLSLQRRAMLLEREHDHYRNGCDSADGFAFTPLCPRLANVEKASRGPQDEAPLAQHGSVFPSLAVATMCIRCARMLIHCAYKWWHRRQSRHESTGEAPFDT